MALYPKENPVIRCPQCGNTDDFAIDAVAYEVAYVHQISAEEAEANPDSGPPDYLELYYTKGTSGTEWDDASDCRCTTCGYERPLWRFDTHFDPIDASAT
jgi:hypothetical protein